MRKGLIAVLFWLLPFSVLAQTITGQVYREGSTTAIEGASVYYNGSTTGTSTNKQGNFELADKPRIPIVISCIGYHSVSIDQHQPGKPLIIYLKPQTQQLDDVIIYSDTINLKKYRQWFLNEFLGTSTYARACIIKNLKDVRVTYNSYDKKLTAECRKPLVIENVKLGYSITYYLEHFEASPYGFFVSGNYIFKDVSNLADLNKIKRNREAAYDGSRMQLIRALWHRYTSKLGFELFKQITTPITEDDIIVTDKLQQKFIKLPYKVTITHGDKSLTTIQADGISTYIDSDGYYGKGIEWWGTLSYQRIGDLLPYEYQSEKEYKLLTTPFPDR